MRAEQAIAVAMLMRAKRMKQRSLGDRIGKHEATVTAKNHGTQNTGGLGTARGSSPQYFNLAAIDFALLRPEDSLFTKP